MSNVADSLAGRHFVLLDEDQYTVYMMKTLLPTLGAVTFQVCQDVLAAVEALKAAPGPHPIVLVDLDGEQNLGLTMLKGIRTGLLGLPRGLAVLALAGQSDQTSIVKAQDLDVGAVLARPLSKSALHASCRRLGPGGIEPRSAEVYKAVQLPELNRAFVADF
jgi:DNA-binding NarL/FixJ family response regulator